MAMPWLMISVGILIVLLALVAWASKNKKFFKPWTYENWLEVGAIFLLFAYIASRFGRDIFVLGFLGVIYTAIGLIGKYLIKGKKLTAEQRKYITIGLIILVVLGFVAFFLIGK